MAVAESGEEFATTCHRLGVPSRRSQLVTRALHSSITNTKPQKIKEDQENSVFDYNAHMGKDGHTLTFKSYAHNRPLTYNFGGAVFCFSRRSKIWIYFCVQSKKAAHLTSMLCLSGASAGVLGSLNALCKLKVHGASALLPLEVAPAPLGRASLPAESHCLINTTSSRVMCG